MKIGDLILVVREVIQTFEIQKNGQQINFLNRSVKNKKNSKCELNLNRSDL